ncbi:hypothetical protein Pmi06nite_18940 [Planotetraspora mira]|uniref:Integrase n=1 Tax=Planotetraspora mira TaxID=58121 RepID=A0A8J3TNI9_9ACTN|nr:hypothetical protein Pmi06nite_18940 [Planotetraspora mira]
MMGTRKPNDRSTIYLGRDGLWYGYVTVGVKPDGSPIDGTARRRPKQR